MVMLNSRGVAAIGGGHQMLIRRAIFGGVVCLISLGSAPSLHSEEQAAESNNTDAPATEKQTTDDKKTIEIPLSEIWAVKMPGTRDVEELEPEVKATKERLDSLPPTPEVQEQLMQMFQNSLVWQICQALEPVGKKKKQGPALPYQTPSLSYLRRCGGY